MNDKSKKLIFIHSFFYPDYSAGSQMLTDLSFDLAKNGFDVTVIVSKKLYNDVKKSLPNKEKINDVDVQRVSSLSLKKNSYVGRALNYISLEIAIIIKLFALIDKRTVVVIMTDPPLLNVFLYLIIKFKKAIIVNWLQDLFPEVAVSAGLFREKSYINRALKKCRNLVLRKSDKNVVIGSIMSTYLKDLGVDENKIIRIENWSHGSKIYPIPNSCNEVRGEWGLGDDFVVGYSGNLGRAHDVSTIIVTMEKLQFVKNIKFLFIGGGVGLDKIKKYAQENSLYNVIFKPYQYRKRLGLSLNCADVHWVTLDPKMEGFIVPSKFYGILATARPVIFIGDENGELAQDIRRIGCGESVSIGDADKLTSLITLYSERSDTVAHLGNLGRKEFNRSYDFPIASRRFQKLFNDFEIL